MKLAEFHRRRYDGVRPPRKRNSYIVSRLREEWEAKEQQDVARPLLLLSAEASFEFFGFTRKVPRDALPSVPNEISRGPRLLKEKRNLRGIRHKNLTELRYHPVLYLLKIE